jgi:putative transposase
MEEVLEENDTIDGFLHQLSLRFPYIFKILKREKVVQDHTLFNRPDVEELNNQVDQLKRAAVPKPESNLAKKHAIEQLIARGYKRKEIARRLGVSRKTVYNLLKTV